MVRIAILTVSDRSFSGEREDLSGPALAEAVMARGWTVSEKSVVPDEAEAIKRELVRIADGLNLLSRKFTASHANHGAPYNTFLPSPTCMPSKLPAGDANALELRTDILCESGESYS